MTTAAAKTNFKFCTVCTSAQVRPISKLARKCPTCGGNKFRAPTCEEIAKEQEQIAKLIRFQNEILGMAA